METQMLRAPEVTARTGLSRVTIWRRVRAGTFPPPVELGTNSIGWPEAEITAWLDSFAGHPSTAAAETLLRNAQAQIPFRSLRAKLGVFLDDTHVVTREFTQPDRLRVWDLEARPPLVG